MTFTAGILTVSDKGARGERTDTSGPALKAILEAAGFSVLRYEIVPDEQDRIRDTLIAWADLHRLNLILTTGGTGFAPRDRTPEATAAAIDRPAPGISEAIRFFGLQKTPRAMLSRGVSGARGRTLIVNLPGSERGARESIEAVLFSLPHALELLCGQGGECGTPGPGKR
jgi:molybdopterin adenylyltransferase